MWLLADEIRNQIEHGMSVGTEFTAVQLGQMAAASKDFGKMSVRGKTAVIPIEGVLTQKRDFFAAFFGGGNTLYPDIISSIQAANSHDSVEDIELSVGMSPGGNVSGLFPAMDAIKNSAKPVKAVVRQGALSGAYGLVSQASGGIVAADKGTEFGSVGVAYDTYVSDDEVSITSTNAPKKRPDLKTEEGRAVVRERLDEIEGLFMKSIAIGRKVSLAAIRTDYGQGGVVLAERALKAGMIDSIGVIESQNTETATAANREVSMDLEKLKAEYPDVYAAAVDIGTQGERDRVCGHLKMGETSGDMKTAVAAIEDGSGMTATLTAAYLSAGMKQSAIAARAADNQDVDVPAETPDGDSLSAQTAKLLSARGEAEGLING